MKGKNKNDDSQDANRRRNRGGAENEELVGGDDYEKWEAKNNDSITKIVVEFFPKYFLFFALCVGFWASRAPTDFAVALAYSEIIVRCVQVYAYYYNNQILVAACIAFGAFINVLLIFTGLVHKY